MAMWCVLVHEVAHALTATLLGQPPKEIELTPMGAVMRLEDEEALSPLRRAVMLAAGPAVTALLVLGSLWMTARGWLPPLTGRRLLLTNMTILLVNLLPALPLDGGRLLSLLLRCCLPGDVVGRVMMAVGTAMGLGAIGISLWTAWRWGNFNWSLAAVGCFLMYAAARATTTGAMDMLRRMMDRRLLLESRGYAPVRRIAILSGTPVHRAVRLLSPRALTEFAVVEQGTMRILAVMTEEQMIAACLDCPQMNCGEAALAQKRAKTDKKA